MKSHLFLHIWELKGSRSLKIFFFPLEAFLCTDYHRVDFQGLVDRSSILMGRT